MDFLDSSFYAFGDPHAVWAQLRERDPVRYFDPGDGREPFWVVTRYDDVCRVLKEYESFSSRRGTMLCIVDLSMPDIASDQMMPDTDPPRHGQLRDPLNRALTRRAVETREDDMREIVRELLRPGLSGEPFDLAQAALMFPMAFTGQIMGMPEESWARMSRLTTMTIAYDDPEYAEGPPKSTLRQAHHELFAFFRDEVERRDRDQPADDLIGILLSMDVDDNRLTDQQIILNCYSLLLGANVTTPHAVCTAVAMFAEHPEQFKLLRESPELRDRAVDEILRWSSPASHFMRYATQDVELGGQQIRAGQPVSVWLGSANRDETAFDDPYRFDITRRPNRHVAFGIGPHYCIGSGLARLGLRVLLEQLVELYDGMEVIGEVGHLQSNFVAGYKHMNVRFTPVDAS
uniref:Putative cytochrome P450 hydroxylase n=1 Tax=uncultured bacterium esnapd17 TaxID=1366598 RepID=S5UBS2_9BACT|nr:putative cytochrome P450 hydroxylase [uncultured bacterium esnapd17]